MRLRSQNPNEQPDYQRRNSDNQPEERRHKYAHRRSGPPPDIVAPSVTRLAEKPFERSRHEQCDQVPPQPVQKSPHRSKVSRIQHSVQRKPRLTARNRLIRNAPSPLGVEIPLVTIHQSRMTRRGQTMQPVYKRATSFSQYRPPCAPLSKLSPRLARPPPPCPCILRHCAKKKPRLMSHHQIAAKDSNCRIPLARKGFAGQLPATIYRVCLRINNNPLHKPKISKNVFTESGPTLEKSSSRSSPETPSADLQAACPRSFPELGFHRPERPISQ